eukprot:9151833-Pyramimonas_sp.AAC.1
MSGYATDGATGTGDAQCVMQNKVGDVLAYRRSSSDEEANQSLLSGKKQSAPLCDAQASAASRPARRPAKLLTPGGARPQCWVHWAPCGCG